MSRPAARATLSLLRVTLCRGDAELGGTRPGSRLHSQQLARPRPGAGGLPEGLQASRGSSARPVARQVMCLQQPCKVHGPAFYCTHFTDENTRVQTRGLGKAPTLSSWYFSLWRTAGGEGAPGVEGTRRALLVLESEQLSECGARAQPAPAADPCRHGIQGRPRSQGLRSPSPAVAVLHSRDSPPKRASASSPGARHLAIALVARLLGPSAPCRTPRGVGRCGSGSEDLGALGGALGRGWLCRELE